MTRFNAEEIEEYERRADVVHRFVHGMSLPGCGRRVSQVPRAVAADMTGGVDGRLTVI